MIDVLDGGIRRHRHPPTPAGGGGGGAFLLFPIKLSYARLRARALPTLFSLLERLEDVGSRAPLVVAGHLHRKWLKWAALTIRFGKKRERKSGVKKEPRLLRASARPELADVGNLSSRFSAPGKCLARVAFSVRSPTEALRSIPSSHSRRNQPRRRSSPGRALGSQEAKEITSFWSLPLCEFSLSTRKDVRSLAAFALSSLFSFLIFSFFLHLLLFRLPPPGGNAISTVKRKNAINTVNVLNLRGCRALFAQK